MLSGIPNSSRPDLRSIASSSSTREVSPVGKERFNPEDYTVLVIDDDTAFLDTVVSWLRESGYKVLQADNISGAKERFQACDVSLVVSDNNIESRTSNDGIILRRFMMKDDGLRKVPFILLSGNEIGPEDVGGLSISFCIRKPVSLACLESVIQRALEQRITPLPVI